MNEERARLQSIAWLDLCPWLMLFRCPGLALRLDTLLLATIGGLLTSGAWWISGAMFFPKGPPADAPAGSVQEQQEAEFALLFNHLRRRPGQEPPIREPAIPGSSVAAPRSFLGYVWDAVTDPAVDPVDKSWRRMSVPYLETLGLHLTLRQFLYLAMGGFLSLVIWAVIGGTITRAAALQLGREERLGLRASLRFGVSKLLSFVAAPLYPLLGVALFCFAMFVFVGLPMNLDLGLLWAGLVWVFALILATLMALLILGLLFGWPLMWATISTEGSDAFDALSRSYAYTFQRPLHYLFFAIVAGVLGALPWMLVVQLGVFIVHLTWWAADWGIFNEERAVYAAAAADGNAEVLKDFASKSAVGALGLRLIGSANSLVHAVTYSFSYGYFWVAATAMYLLLRREVDHTETDEIFTDDEPESFGLPPLGKDAAGVPGVGFEAPGKPAQSFDIPDENDE